MARGINKVILVGNLGADPETRYAASGTAVTKFRIATSEAWRDKQSDTQQERTEWHSIVCFQRLAEITAQYLRKGSKIYIEGSLRTSSWDDPEGNKRYRTEIVARDMQMLDSRGGGGGSNQSYGGAPADAGMDQSPPPNQPQATAASYADASGGNAPAVDSGGNAPAVDSSTPDDDIPF